MPGEVRHARQRRPSPEDRGWFSTREYALKTGVPWSTVRLWCLQGRMPHASGVGFVAVGGGEGRDYRIPLEAVYLDEADQRAA